MTQMREYTPAMLWAEGVRAPAEGYAVLQVLARNAHVDDGYVAMQLGELAFLLLSTERHMRDVVARLVLDGYLDRVGFPGRAGGIRVRVPFERGLLNGRPVGNETPPRRIYGNETDNETPARLISVDGVENETSTRLIVGNETPVRRISDDDSSGNETAGRLIQNETENETDNETATRLIPAAVGNETENETAGRPISDTPYARAPAFSNSPGSNSRTSSDEDEKNVSPGVVVGVGAGRVRATPDRPTDDDGHDNCAKCRRALALADGSKPAPHLTTEERATLVSRWKDKFEHDSAGLPPPDQKGDVEERIDRALQGGGRWPKFRYFVYVNDWLKGDAQKLVAQRRNGHSSKAVAAVGAASTTRPGLEAYEHVGRTFTDDPDDPDEGVPV